MIQTKTILKHFFIFINTDELAQNTENQETYPNYLESCRRDNLSTFFTIVFIPLIIIVALHLFEIYLYRANVPSFLFINSLKQALFLFLLLYTAIAFSLHCLYIESRISHCQQDKRQNFKKLELRAKNSLMMNFIQFSIEREKLEERLTKIDFKDDNTYKNAKEILSKAYTCISDIDISKYSDIDPYYSSLIEPHFGFSLPLKTYEEISEEMNENAEKKEKKKIFLKETNTKLHSLLNDAKRIITIQERDNKLNNILDIFYFFIVLMYMLALAILMFLTYVHNTQDIEIPFFKVPLWTVVSGALGSIASMLYRAYKIKINNYKLEFRRLIARPVLGILISVIVYLFLASTLPNSTTDDKFKNITLLICFIVSFSDRALDTMIRAFIDVVDSRVPERSKNHTDITDSDQTISKE